MLEKYFADGPYRFPMQFGRGAFVDFYAATAEHEDIVRERREWLRTSEARYLAITPEAEPLLSEATALAVEHRTIPANTAKGALAQARFLAENWEPDYLLLTRVEATIRLVCGAVCFPSSWALDEKIGRRIEEIHEVVPGLKPSIGRQIHVFLERLKPGASWTRANWGLSRSSERNQHPSRKLPRLDESVGIEEVFFRIEEQSLVGLPQTGGILFGIRIKIVPLKEFIGHPAGVKLRLALETMPTEMAGYKGLATARERIISFLSN